MRVSGAVALGTASVSRGWHSTTRATVRRLSRLSARAWRSVITHGVKQAAGVDNKPHPFSLVNGDVWVICPCYNTPGGGNASKALLPGLAGLATEHLLARALSSSRERLGAPLVVEDRRSSISSRNQALQARRHGRCRLRESRRRGKDAGAAFVWLSTPFSSASNLLVLHFVRGVQHLDGVLDEVHVGRRGLQVEGCVEAEQGLARVPQLLEECAHLEEDAWLLWKGVL
mmetsp:Transcript_34384/g.81493  ORF Transcript_34384/g.81493 Transcript_34384/m.81493 type:complete len:229 (-) Transcript_34384:2210-2896(-)